MKKTFAVVLISASLAACSGKKETTTPAAKPAMEQKDDATGGARYGGHKTETAPPKSDAAPADPK